MSKSFVGNLCLMEFAKTKCCDQHQSEVRSLEEKKKNRSLTQCSSILRSFWGNERNKFCLRLHLFLRLRGGLIAIQHIPEKYKNIKPAVIVANLLEKRSKIHSINVAFGWFNVLFHPGDWRGWLRTKPHFFVDSEDSDDTERRLTSWLSHLIQVSFIIPSLPQILSRVLRSNTQVL